MAMAKTIDSRSESSELDGEEARVERLLNAVNRKMEILKSFRGIANPMHTQQEREKEETFDQLRYREKSR